MYIPTDERIRITYKFDDLQDATKDFVYNLVQHNIEGKMDAYIASLLKTEDSEMRIDIVLGKDKNDKFNGHFNFFGGGSDFRYENESFEKLDDLVNHAFDRYKEHLSDR